MKITRVEGYKKPNYAVAVAATISVMTVTGCGATDGPDLAGATTVYEPPEEEIQLVGDVAVIDYDGGLSMYTDPEEGSRSKGDEPEYTDEDDDIIRLEGATVLVDDEGSLSWYADPEDELQFEGDVAEYIDDDITDCEDEDVTDCEDGNDVTYIDAFDHLSLDGGAPLYEP